MNTNGYNYYATVELAKKAPKIYGTTINIFYNNLAICAMNAQQPEVATKYFTKAKSTTEKGAGDYYTIWSNLCRNYLIDDKLILAEVEFNQILREAPQQEKENLDIVYDLIYGKAYHKQKLLSEQESFDLFKKYISKAPISHDTIKYSNALYECYNYCIKASKFDSVLLFTKAHTKILQLTKPKMHKDWVYLHNAEGLAYANLKKHEWKTRCFTHSDPRFFST